MTRIISGQFGGRRLRVPPGDNTRPTTDRVREAVFSRLDAWDAVHGARVLDLFAGSGALGLEAASRGARSVVLVDAVPSVAVVLKANIASLGAGEMARAVAEKAQTFVENYARAAPDEPFDLVFLDPPYPLSETELTGILDAVAAPEILSQHGLVVLERSSRSPAPTWPFGVETIRDSTYGETRMWYAERRGVDER